MNKKIWLAVVIILLISIGSYIFYLKSNKGTSAIISVHIPTTLEEKAYISPEKKFEIHIPTGWEQTREWLISATSSDLVFRDPTKGVVAFIEINGWPEDTQYNNSLKDMAGGLVQSFKDIDGTGEQAHLQIISEGTTTFAGEPAYKIEFTFVLTDEKNAKHGYHSRGIVMNRDGFIYIINTYTTADLWNSYNSLMSNSVDTFRFLK
jgi:hypothetical protein